MIARGIGLSGVLLLMACGTPRDVTHPTPVPHGPATTLAATRTPAPTASLWNQEPQSLFGNRRARNVGDILTVIVEIDEAAQMNNSLQRNRTSDEQFSLNALFGFPDAAGRILPAGAGLDPGVDINRSAAASGNGSISRQEKITLQLAAEVVEQRANGHLVILGTQRITVNNERRDLRLYGVVRPEDITRDNTITHEKIAAADIVYSGAGQIANTTAHRGGPRILDILVPF